MKSNFALSLSFEGIRLLHRAAGGWRRVGDVSLDSPDMAADLADLRGKALLLEPDGLRTKLLLPDEQIKYLTLETDSLSDDERLSAARAALDGATPYAVKDLAFDICADGVQTHVAAVALETLAEAEAFATEHAFNPVHFTAVPNAHPYLGAPSFGSTQAAPDILKGAPFQHDDIAVVVIGDADIPTPPPVVEETALPVPEETPTQVVEETSPPVAVDPAPDMLTSAKETTQSADSGISPALGETAAPEQEIAPAPNAPGTTFVSEKDAPTDAQLTDEAAPAPAADTTPIATRTPTTEPEMAAPAPTARFASLRTAQVPTPVQTPELTSTPPQQTAAPPVAANYANVVIPPSVAAPAVVASHAGDETPKKAGFLSRRRAKKAAVPVAPPPAPAAKPKKTKKPKAAASEADRMTIFGARASPVGGKPRFLGLILTAALLVFLAGVAAWASVFLDDGIKLSRLFGDRSAPEFSTIQDPPRAVPDEQQDDIVVASLDPELTPEDAAVLDALRTPVLPVPEEMSQAELEAKYAATGIWSRGPQAPPIPTGLIDSGDNYVTGIDPISSSTDAVALPGVASFATDLAVPRIVSPTAAGTQFALDARGLVVPTAQGTLSPEGVIVYLGRPSVTPSVIPTRFEVVPEDTVVRSFLAELRPQVRPAALTEQYERAQLDGLTRTELASLRPTLRPRSIQEQAAAVETAAARATAAIADETDAAVNAALETPNPLENATRLAVQASVRPDPRPRNFARIVRRAARQAPEEEVRVASAVATVAPRTVKPKIPTTASVAQQATVKNVLNLRKVNLIGVYGKSSNRRALVRLSNGRYRKVTIGDRIDGGRVSAIGQSELRYVKGGRNVVLKMPRG